MGSNMISYERFTNLPVNISQYGATTEEYELTRGKVEPNLQIGPMPTRAAEPLLAPRLSSDNLRVAAPAQPPVNVFEGFRHDHLTIRPALQKGHARISSMIGELVRGGTVPGLGDNQRGQIVASLSREDHMIALLERVNRMQEGIFAKLSGGARG